MQSGEQDAQNDQHRIDLLNPLDWSLQFEALQHVGKEFEEEHGGVRHHAHAHFEHDRVRVHVDQLVPDVPGAAEVEQQSNDEEHIAQECRQHRGTHHTVQALDVEQIDRAHNAETAGRQHDAAQAVEANPEAPGKLVRHVRNRAQAVEISE